MKKHPEIVVRNCTFRETVRFSHCQNAPTIVFVGCVFKKGICARDAVIGRSLKLIDCEIAALDTNGNDIALDLENAQLEGELFLYNCRLGGRLFAPRLRTRSNFRVRGCHIAPVLSDMGAHIYRRSKLTREQSHEALVERGWKFNRTFNGPAVSLEGVRIDGDLEITVATVEQKPTANSSQALRLASPQITYTCVIDGELNVSGAIVSGRVVIFETICRGNLVFRGSRLEQSALITWCSVFGGLDFANTKCESDLNCGQSTFAGAVDFSNASIAGNLVLYNSEIGENLLLTSANVQGAADLKEATVKGDAILYRTTINRNVEVGGLTVFRDLNCTFATMGALLSLQWIEDIDASGKVSLSSDRNLEVKRDLSISGADIRWIGLHGINVGGHIQIVTGKFGIFDLGLGLGPTLSDPYRFQPKPCRAGAVFMHAIEVEGRLDVSALEVDLPKGWYSARRIKETHDEGFRLTQSKIGGDLVFFQNQQKANLERRIGWPTQQKRRIAARQVRKLTPNVHVADDEEHFPWADNEWEHRQRSFWGGLTLQANEIRGKLDLRSICVKGPIYLNDTSVGLDVYMDAFVDDKGAPDLQNKTLATTCLHLNAEKLQCNGDVNFTGLRVLRSMTLPDDEKPKLESRKYGVLLAHEARVKGQMLFLPVEKAKQNHEEAAAAAKQRRGKEDGSDFVPGYALIDGASVDNPALDLTAVEANYLLVTGNNVPHDGARVSLERGRFGRLEVVAPPPGPIDLTKVTVGRWVFGDKVEPNAAEYISVLKQMDPFDRSIWVGVETDLRNQGQGDQADKVYRAMRWQARDRGGDRKPWSNHQIQAFIVLSLVALILLSIVGVPLPLVLVVGVIIGTVLLYIDREGLHGALGWGTYSWVPMIGALVLLPLSVYIFSNPQYVRASSDLLQVLDKTGIAIANPANSEATQAESTAPTRADIEKHISALDISPRRIGEYDGKYYWTSLDGVALTLRYQVPIMSSLTHSWWEASDNNIWFLGNMTAERYATMLVLYHWIAWPLFLIWLGARVIRSKQS